MKNRYLQRQIIEDALWANKIAFLSGPRQVGKTTLAQSILDEVAQNGRYYNFDDIEFKKAWIRNPNLLINEKEKLIVFDEIHKDKKWKSKIKGLYDLHKKKHQFLVTGSARLDFYRKSGDSLQGRYLPYKLHPFTLCESNNVKPPPQKEWEEFATKKIVNLNELVKFSGFPEPLWDQNENKSQRWHRLYRERLIREDARDFENIRDINLLENLSILLPDRIGSQLSIESLRVDIGTSYDTVKRWLFLLESLYFCYRIKPYSTNIKNSIRKEPKLFLTDWSLIEDSGSQWENMIAGHLLKSAHAWTDAAFGEFELFYIRDKQKREVDFFMTKNKKPWLLVEVKSQNHHITNSLKYFNNQLKPIFCFQIVKEKRLERPKTLTENIEVISAERFLSGLN